jgi:uncharacterized protein
VTKAPLSIGVISDTHGLLREEAIEALRGSELIIHAGDIGEPEIIEALEKLAPVVAVRGNTDHGGWAHSLPETAIAEAGDGLIYVLHDIHALDLNPGSAGFRMVVSGHSHKPERTERAGVIYLNPGSAGPRRFQLPTTLAKIEVGNTQWRIDFIDLLNKSASE